MVWDDLDDLDDLRCLIVEHDETLVMALAYWHSLAPPRAITKKATTVMLMTLIVLRQWVSYDLDNTRCMS